MPCPTLAELPPPPAGRTGFPWTEDTPGAPPTRPDGSPWPRISITIPSYNQGQYIEETIRAILLQGYPDLELTVMDGGSTDDSVAVVKRYAPWIKTWVSEKDKGQADAINKGLAHATGALFQWINSDDVVLKGALREIGRLYDGNTVAGQGIIGVSQAESKMRRNRNLSAANIFTRKAKFYQQGLWFPTDQVRAIGIKPEYQYAFDWDLIIRCLDRVPTVRYTDMPLVFFRLHDASKTVSSWGRFIVEGHKIRAELARELTRPDAIKACRQEQREKVWERYIARSLKRPSAAGAARLFRLAVRRPGVRLTRKAIEALAKPLIARGAPKA